MGTDRSQKYKVRGGSFKILVHLKARLPPGLLFAPATAEGMQQDRPGKRGMGKGGTGKTRVE